MTTRTKSILIIIASVVAGILIGALAVGAVVNYRVDELRALRRPGGPGQAIESIIQPQDETQRREIREAVRRSAERNRQLRAYIHQQHFTILDSLRADLQDILTEEQMDRLTEWLREQRRPMGPRGRGPGGQGGMGGMRGMGGPPPRFPPPGDGGVAQPDSQ